MVEFEVEYIGDEPDEMMDRLSQIDVAVKRRTNEALMETAQEVKADLEESSPVDTGKYQRSWYIFQVDYNEVWILNETEHAKFVMLPNAKMVGSAEADLPAQGVLHNVKGVARKHSKGLSLNMADELAKMIERFKVRI